MKGVLEVMASNWFQVFIVSFEGHMNLLNGTGLIVKKRMT